MQRGAFIFERWDKVNSGRQSRMLLSKSLARQTNFIGTDLVLSSTKVWLDYSTAHRKSAHYFRNRS